MQVVTNAARIGATTPADQQSANDPLRPTASDGWSPDRVIAVRSRNRGGFLGSTINFTLGGIAERPGQRLSVAQVDALAPFFADEFGLDERYVRQELAKVYLYVGGPSTRGNAMTIGHHVYVPDERSLDLILSPSGKRWLAHELTHTMQFLAYDGGSPQRFLADYLSGLVVGRNPEQPGTGTGTPVWGALFTGLRTVGSTRDQIGDGASSLLDQAASTVLPATVVSVPVALTAAGFLATARATTNRALLGSGSALRTALGTIAAPAIVGAAIGARTDEIGTHAALFGAATGGALAAATLLMLGSLHGGAPSLVLGGGAVLAGAGIGLVSARASRATTQGWSSTASVLRELRDRPADGAPDEPLSMQQALHDTHWQEIDAEASALRFVHGQWHAPKPGDPPITGRIPTAPTSLPSRIRQDATDRLDWGLKVPLVVGVPAALAVGTGVLATRTGSTVLRTTLREGKGVGAAIDAALALLGSSNRGVINSMQVGGAVTIAPLIAGGVAGPIAFTASGSDTTARVAGAATGSLLTGVMLTLLLAGHGHGLIATSGKVLAGMAAGGVLGLAAGGVATDALNPHQREYLPNG